MTMTLEVAPQHRFPFIHFPMERAAAPRVRSAPAERLDQIEGRRRVGRDYIEQLASRAMGIGSPIAFETDSWMKASMGKSSQSPTTASDCLTDSTASFSDGSSNHDSGSSDSVYKPMINRKCTKRRSKRGNGNKATDTNALDVLSSPAVRQRCTGSVAHTENAEETASMPMTFMVRNIPCRLTKAQLKGVLDSMGLKGKYSFLYLPTVERGCSNLGYFFINFDGPAAAAECVQVFDGFVFPDTNSTKVCTVTPARVQGGAFGLRLSARKQKKSKTR